MQCLLGRSTDDRFAREMYKKCEGHDRFELAPKMRVDHQFCVRHYAGKVVYSTEGIIDKNRDTLQQEGVDMLLSSGSDFTVLMGEIEAKSTKVVDVHFYTGAWARESNCCTAVSYAYARSLLTWGTGREVTTFFTVWYGISCGTATVVVTVALACVRACSDTARPK